MTPRRLRILSAAMIAAAAGVGAVSVISYGMAGAVPTLPQQPRDPRPNQARPATETEKQLQATVAATPQDQRAAQELAKLQEGRGALADAEATLRRSAQASPTESARWQALAAFYTRAGQFERAIETLEGVAQRDASSASASHLVATLYFAKLSDPALSRDDRMSYVQRGLAAETRALAAQPDFFEALVYKGLLLRAQAENEPDAARRAALIAEADDLRLRAGKSVPTTSTTAPNMFDTTAYPQPPPPPPVPGAGEIKWEYAETSFVRVDGSSSPRKIKDVRPVYPPMAIRLGVEGRVVVQAAINERGAVVAARVVESIPLLNQPTIDAVQQWRFDPVTIPSGGAPVVINVEARFFPEK
jgi:TonB family protein